MEPMEEVPINLVSEEVAARREQVGEEEVEEPVQSSTISSVVVRSGGRSGGSTPTPTCSSPGAMEEQITPVLQVGRTTQHINSNIILKLSFIFSN